MAAGMKFELIPTSDKQVSKFDSFLRRFAKN